MDKQQIQKQLNRISNAKETSVSKALKKSLEDKLKALEGKTVNK